jgi:hypothetical protein
MIGDSFVQFWSVLYGEMMSAICGDVGESLYWEVSKQIFIATVAD